MDELEKFYQLFAIFNLLAKYKEYELLSSPSFLKPYLTNENKSWNRAIQYILQNFQGNLKVKDLLKITNMSNTTFFKTFKNHLRMPFKSYLINIRIGYACRLLADNSFNISQVAYESGFGNLSNFNRRFKDIKGITLGEYRKYINRK